MNVVCIYYIKTYKVRAYSRMVAKKVSEKQMESYTQPDRQHSHNATYTLSPLAWSWMQTQFQISIFCIGEIGTMLDHTAVRLWNGEKCFRQSLIRWTEPTVVALRFCILTTTLLSNKSSIYTFGNSLFSMSGCMPSLFNRCKRMRETAQLHWPLIVQYNLSLVFLCVFVSLSLDSWQHIILDWQ